MSGKSGFRKLGVIGAGNMGSGIAQKMATEGFDVVLVDLDDEKVARGMQIIEQTLAAGVKRRIFKPEQTAAILARVSATADWDRLADADLVVEAVFEDLEVKRKVFARLDSVCRPDAVLATNTSSFLVTDLAASTARAQRVIGLHYFYHPAMNRLVEVIPGKRTADEVMQTAWAVQEQLGKTPIASADVSGFVVNRFFVPWLNEAVRLVEEGVADIPTVEAACKETFGVGMGPFELMNVTGVPIAMHAATTLGQQFGPLYAPAEALERQVASGDPWPLAGDPGAANFSAVAERMLGVVFYVAAALVEERVGTIEDTDIGARVGLRWPKGPFEMINRRGIDAALKLAANVADRWKIDVPAMLGSRAAERKPFEFRLVKSETRDGVATLTINRPDAMNALNETVVGQLHDAFRAAAGDPAVRGIVIAGAGKAFIAGADIRFFVRNLDSGDVQRIVEFTKAGHALLDEIDGCAKPVVARLDGLALGGGLELALACDTIVASDKASMAFPETGIGIYPGLGGTQRLSRRVGRGLAKWLVFTGQMIGAKEAQRIGLADFVTSHDALDRAVRQAIESRGPAKREELGDDLAALESFFEANTAKTLLAGDADPGSNERAAKAMKQVGHKAPVALRLAEQLIDRGAELPLHDGLALELEHLVEIFGTADAYEGLSSLGKKRPEFTGR